MGVKVYLSCVFCVSSASCVSLCRLLCACVRAMADIVCSFLQGNVQCLMALSYFASLASLVKPLHCVCGLIKNKPRPQPPFSFLGA